VSRIYWDSMMFLYLLEAHPLWGPKVRSVLTEIVRRGDLLCTSAFSIGEVLTGPRRRGSHSGVDAVKKYFASGAIDVLPFTEHTADKYGSICAAVRVSQADGVHLATAAEANIDLFFTNDIGLRKLSVPGIRFFADLDGKIL